MKTEEEEEAKYSKLLLTRRSYAFRTAAMNLLSPQGSGLKILSIKKKKPKVHRDSKFHFDF